MANTSYYKVVCQCGHEGKIRLRKNDTPYGNSDWYSYMLIGLEGWPLKSQRNENWKDIFAAMQPTCTNCKKKLTVQNLRLDE